MQEEHPLNKQTNNSPPPPTHTYQPPPPPHTHTQVVLLKGKLIFWNIVQWCDVTGGLLLQGSYK